MPAHNPVLEAVELIEQALRVASTAELHDFVRLRAPKHGKLWEQLHNCTIACCNAMREAAFMYGEPLPPPAPFCLVKTPDGNEVMRMTGRIGNVVKLEPLHPTAKQERLNFAAWCQYGEEDPTIPSADFDFRQVLYLIQELQELKPA